MTSRVLFFLLLVVSPCLALASTDAAEILTPAPPLTPRINGASVFGVRPGSPFLYQMPVTGARPMRFSVEPLPPGLSLDAATGRMTGTLTQAGEIRVVLRAANAHGSASRPFRIVVGERIALTPPMGWNSWNSWAESINQDRVVRAAKALVSSGLVEHGWSYVNVDDAWQGVRGGPHHALQGNEKFPDMKGMVDAIHALGLKAGIYSTPWVTSYAGYRGGSGDDAAGSWHSASGPDAAKTNEANHRHGQFTFERNDATQWAAWGFDYLKYDWNPNDVAHTQAMSVALRATGRDIVFSLSNSAPIEHAAEFSRLANAWRTTGDIVDAWTKPVPQWWQHSVSDIGFNQDAWVPYGGPGHWNDPDMLVVGWIGWGDKLRPTKLTPAEQYSHVSLWALLSAPLLIGCDLERLDAFTLGLLGNDEVIALNQDALGQSARRVATFDNVQVFSKPLEDGSTAVGLFNLGEVAQSATVSLKRLGLGSRQQVRDVWRQKDVGVAKEHISVTVGPHNVVLYRLTDLAGSSPRP